MFFGKDELKENLEDLDQARAVSEVKSQIIKKYKNEIFFGQLKVAAVVLLLFGEVFLIGALLFQQSLKDLFTKKEDLVALVNIDKEITAEYVDRVIAKMKRALDEKKYKEFLVVMRCPGGSPTSSEELASFLRYVQRKKPVTMYVDSMAASGGYYIASAIKPIYANKNAIVGSIGVILPHYSMEKLAKRVGVEDDFVAAGKFKKPISLLKDIDPVMKEYLQKNLLTPTYRNFLADVATNRGIPVQKLERFAQGQIFIASDPSIKGILVDETTHLYQIKEKIRKKYPKERFAFVDILKEKKSALPFFKVSLDLDLAKSLEKVQHLSW